MALPVWPTTVEHRPAPSMWAPPTFTTPRATQMEGGNTRLRIKPGDAVATSRWGQDLNGLQVDAFRTFYRDTLGNGAGRFTMPVCLDGVSYESRTVQIASGTLSISAFEGGGALVSFEMTVF